MIADAGMLDEIGKVDDDAPPLPLKLEYPPTRMQNEVALLQNALAQNLPRSQRKYEDAFVEQRSSLLKTKEALEDEIASLRARAQKAEASADDERQRLEARRRQHRIEEEARQERERERLRREQEAQAAERRLRQQHQDDERRTKEAFAGAVGRDNNASIFGDTGDMRMCPRCKAGPFTKDKCNDLGAHNDSSTEWQGVTVASTPKPNNCRNCDFFTENWTDWLLWDGVFGPH